MTDEKDKPPVLKLAGLLEKVCDVTVWYRRSKSEWIRGYPGRAYSCPHTPNVDESSAQATALWPMVVALLDAAEKLTNGISRVVSKEITDRVEIERTVFRNLKALRGEMQFLQQYMGVSDPCLVEYPKTTQDELCKSGYELAAILRTLESCAEKLRQIPDWAMLAEPGLEASIIGGQRSLRTRLRTEAQSGSQEEDGGEKKAKQKGCPRGKKRGAKGASGEDAKDETPVMWQGIQERLLRLRILGEPYTTQRELAERLECSLSIINKAIHKSERLKGWMGLKPKGSPKVHSLNEVVTDQTADQRESDPADFLPEEDIDQIMSELISQAGPGEEAELRSYTPDQRRKIVGLHLQQSEEPDSKPPNFEVRKGKPIRLRGRTV